jgi:Tfp pilus assembly protein PilP
MTTMRLSHACGKFLAILAVAACLVPAGWAQAPAAKSEKPAAKPKTAAPHKRAAAKKPAAAKKAAPTPAADTEATASLEPVAKRDPFAPLISDRKESGAMNLPPGKAGLVIATMRVDGAVRSAMGMIAIVSNPSNSVYFIREGDRLYDGDVEKIGLDGVTFRENSKDAFGHAVERTVTKRIYPSAGELQ